MRPTHTLLLLCTLAAIVGAGVILARRPRELPTDARFRPVAHAPTHLVTAAVAGVDGNGVPVIATGGRYAFPPFDNANSITLWRRK